MHCRFSVLTLVLSLVASALSTVSNPGKAEGCSGASPSDHCDPYYARVAGDTNVPLDQGVLIENSRCTSLSTAALVVRDKQQQEVAGTTTYPLEGYLAWRPAAPLEPDSNYSIEFQGFERRLGFQTGKALAGGLVGATSVEVKVAQGQLASQACCVYSRDCAAIAASCADVRTITAAVVTLDPASGDSEAARSVLERRVFDSSNNTLLYFDVAKSGPLSFEAPTGSSHLCVAFDVVRLTDQAIVQSPPQCVDIPTVTRVATTDCPAFNALLTNGTECWSSELSDAEVAELRAHCAAQLPDAGSPDANAEGGDGLESAQSNDTGCSLGGRAPTGAWGAFFGIVAALYCLRRKRAGAP